MSRSAKASRRKAGTRVKGLDTAGIRAGLDQLDAALYALIANTVECELPLSGPTSDPYHIAMAAQAAQSVRHLLEMGKVVP